MYIIFDMSAHTMLNDIEPNSVWKLLHTGNTTNRILTVMFIFSTFDRFCKKKGASVKVLAVLDCI